MVKKNTKRKLKRSNKEFKKAKSNKNNQDMTEINQRLLFLDPKYLLRAHGNKKTKHNKKIIDIPFSKYKSKGTRATLGSMGFHYQEYRNIGFFFHNMKDCDFKSDLNYNNPILSLKTKK